MSKILNSSDTKNSRHFSALLLFGFFLSFFAFSFTSFTSDAFARSNPKYASIVMDADTGFILHQRHADKRLHPASLTKVMTLLLLFDAIEAGKVHLGDRMHVSRRASGMQPSKIGLRTGETIRVKDAIYSLVTKSANDVAVVVAEHLAGTETRFAKAMTKRAREIGMSRTIFKNASGLHNKHQISSARDIAKMARYIIQAYPSYYKYFSRRTFKYKGKTYRNHNRLLGKYDGMDGMKTGYIRASGFNLVASAKRDDQRIIAVVFGGRSSKTRNSHMASLLDRGFKKSQMLRVASMKAPLPSRKPGASPSVVLASASTQTSAPPVPASVQQKRVVDTQPSDNIRLSMADAALTPQMQSRTAAPSSSFKDGKYAMIMEQGGMDPATFRRVSAGAMAIAAHTSDRAQSATPAALTRNARKNTKRNWSIQVGAFRSKRQTNNAIHKSISHLPRAYREGTPFISPLKTRSGWMYRARLAGYSRGEAFDACSYLKDCMPLAPN